VTIQPGGAPNHDPNETVDQISADNLTQGAPADEDEATRTARRARNQRKEARRFMQPNMLEFHRTTSTMSSTTLQIRFSEHQLLR